MTRRGLPLAVWAGLLAAGCVALAGVVPVVLLLASGHLDAVAVEVMAAGVGAGLGLGLVAVVAASRLAAGLRALRGEALQRLQDPAAPVEGLLAGPVRGPVRGSVGGPAAVRTRRPVAARASTELVELARVLDALHLRVRVGDEVGERHRRDAETAGAGVFELLSGLVAAEEGARGQLAAELHDTVAQSLMTARSLLATATTMSDVVELADYVEDAEEQLRAVMARTRPPALRDGDLATAVDDLRLDMHSRYALQVHLAWPATAHPLPLATAITVYRFFQEALLNVVKHADVEEADVSLLVTEDCVRATVADRGPGFDPATVRPDRGRHVGLGLLRERARLSGGALEVESAAGVGTVLSLWLPRPSGSRADAPPPEVVRPALAS